MFGDGNQRPVPVSLAMLPYTVVNNVDRLEHEVNLLLDLTKIVFNLTFLIIERNFHASISIDRFL